MIRSENRRKRPKFEKFPVKFPVSREFRAETGSPLTVSSASYYVLDIAYIIVFLGSLFSREFAGVTGLVFKAIRGRDGCTRDFGRGRYENLSGAISWLTFFAGRAAHVRRSQRDWRRELAESTICSQRKPRSFRCSAQSVGSRGVRRINVLAVSCGGFRPLTMAVVMSGASQGRRRRE